MYKTHSDIGRMSGGNNNPHMGEPTEHVLQTKESRTYGLILIRFSSMPSLSGMMHKNSYFVAIVLAQRTRDVDVVRVGDGKCKNERWSLEDDLRIRGI